MRDGDVGEALNGVGDGGIHLERQLLGDVGVGQAGGEDVVLEERRHAPEHVKLHVEGSSAGADEFEELDGSGNL